MRLEMTVSEGIYEQVRKPLVGPTACQHYVEALQMLGVKQPEFRPAEYVLQLPKMSKPLRADFLGIEIELQGVSRAGRDPKVFESVRALLQSRFVLIVSDALGGSHQHPVQLRVVIALDMPIENNVGELTTLVEGEPVWLFREE